MRQALIRRVHAKGGNSIAAITTIDIERVNRNAPLTDKNVIAAAELKILEITLPSGERRVSHVKIAAAAGAHKSVKIAAAINQRIGNRIDVEATDSRQRTRIEEDPVVAAITLDRVSAVPTVEDVVPAVAIDIVISGAAVQRVIAGPAPEPIVIVATKQDVIAAIAVKLVFAGAALQLIIVITTANGVVASTAEQNVIAVAAIERVVAIATIERVSAVLAGQNIGPNPAWRASLPLPP